MDAPGAATREATGGASVVDVTGARLPVAAFGGVAARATEPVAVRSTETLDLNGLEKGLSENLATSLLQAPSAAATIATTETRMSAEAGTD